MNTKKNAARHRLFAATAIGLAVFLDSESSFELSERFSRHFGVFREAEAGTGVVFDPIVCKDAALPTDGRTPLVVRRRYRAAHNIGHFRFVECSRLVDGRGMPEAEARARVAAQADDDERLAAADVVLDGTGTDDELRHQVDVLWSRLAQERSAERDADLASAEEHRLR